MTYDRRTLPELIAQAQADIEGNLPGTDAKVRRTNLNVLARLHAAGEHGLYGFIAWLVDQVFPDTAEEQMLLRHASIWLSSGRVAAAYATGGASITGTDGTVIVADTIFQRADGAQYAVDADVTVAGGVATLALTAVTEGQASNAVVGTQLSLAAPIFGLASTATVAAGGISGGADIEEIEALRLRVLARIKNPPQGGAAWDYPEWAKEVAGVTRAWCYPKEAGRGTITVRFVRDNDASMIPDVGEVAAVQAWIDGKRPPSGELYVVAPIADATNYTIHLSPDTPAIRAAVEAELRDLHLRECIPGGNYFDPDTRTLKTGGTLLLSHIREAISLAAGENDHTLTAPAANVVAATGHISTFGVITWA